MGGVAVRVEMGYVSYDVTGREEKKVRDGKGD
jgi:hypothetical protein